MPVKSTIEVSTGKAPPTPKPGAKAMPPNAKNEYAMKFDKRGLIEVDGGSTCFESLRYDAKNEEMIATFFRGGALVYSYPMSREEAKDWLDDPSLGGYFNAEIRE